MGFEALYDLFAPDSRGVEDFSAFYVMRKTKENGRFFATWSDLERLIVNLVNNNHDWRETVIRVFDAWEAAALKDCGVVPTTWNQGALQHGGVSVTRDVQERVQRLYQIDFDQELVIGSELTFCAPNRLKGSAGGLG